MILFTGYIGKQSSDSLLSNKLESEQLHIRKQLRPQKETLCLKLMVHNTSIARTEIARNLCEGLPQGADYALSQLTCLSRENAKGIRIALFFNYTPDMGENV
jgi:hypothetical protein